MACCTPAEAMDRIAAVATSKVGDVPAALSSIVRLAAGPLSEQGVRQVGAALADIVARQDGTLPFPDRARVVEIFCLRLEAHGIVVMEAPR
jgi:hypothetical protein